MMVLLGTIESNCCLATNGLYTCQRLWIDPLQSSTNRMLGYNNVPYESDVIAVPVNSLDAPLGWYSNAKSSLCYCTQCAQVPLTHRYCSKPGRLSIGPGLVLLAQR